MRPDWSGRRLKVRGERQVLMHVWAIAIAVALGVTSPVSAQSGRSSSEAVSAVPSAEQAAPAQDQAAPAPKDPAPPSSELPVSLDRIRGGLAKPPPGSALKHMDIKPDFVVRIEEKAHVEAILSKLDFKGAGPTPLGGLYAYELQQQLGNKNHRPLAQPYAAFTGKEMITLAIEGLMQRYLGGKILDSITSAQREGAEQAAREEVALAIAAYCDARPDKGATLYLCTEVLER